LLHLSFFPLALNWDVLKYRVPYIYFFNCRVYFGNVSLPSCWVSNTNICLALINWRWFWAHQDVW
jgi:hypothetical protein